MPLIKWLQGNAATTSENKKSEIISRTLNVVTDIQAWTDTLVYVMSDRGRKVMVGLRAAARTWQAPTSEQDSCKP